MADHFLQAVRDAIQEIAETMLFVEIAPGPAGSDRCTMGADVSAVIGYSGAIKGSLRLAGPMPSVLKLASALLGEERDSLDKEMEDGFSEMANMIAGGVQSRLEATVGTIRMSPPVVISGRNHQVSSDRSFHCASHQFELDGEPFFTEIYYSEEPVPAHAGDKYGFSLTIPMPHAAGFSESVGEGGEIGPSYEAEPAVKTILLDEAALAKAVKEAFASEVTSWSQEVTQHMVRELLPALAEQLVRAEIERIKREGL